MTYIDPSRAVIAKMIAFDKECVYTHLVSDEEPLARRIPVEVERYWEEDTSPVTRWQRFRRWLHEVAA